MSITLRYWQPGCDGYPGCVVVVQCRDAEDAAAVRAAATLREIGWRR